VGELCVTPTLKSEVAAIQAAWRDAKRDVDPHLSALVWGGAGMLARSHLTKVPFFGHPARRRLLQETRMFPTCDSAGQTVKLFVQGERVRMLRFRSQGLSGSVAHVSVSPLAVKAIEESASPQDLLPAALQLRNDYTELRHWIGEYQRALDQEDERQQLKYEKVLRAIAETLERQYGARDSGGTNMSIGTSFFQMAVPQTWIDKVRNSFGVRSVLCNLIMAPRGMRAIEKLVAMFGEGRSLLGRDVMVGLQSRYSIDASATSI
jgi:hypothetical protein